MSVFDASMDYICNNMENKWYTPNTIVNLPSPLVMHVVLHWPSDTDDSHLHFSIQDLWFQILSISLTKWERLCYWDCRTLQNYGNNFCLWKELQDIKCIHGHRSKLFSKGIPFFFLFHYKFFQLLFDLKPGKMN
jgi:hypothetical protein